MKRINFIEKSFVTIFMVVINLSLLAQVRTTIADGKWNTASTWDCTCVPAAGEDAVINGHNIQLDGSNTINNITITTAGILDHKPGNKMLTVNGNYTNNGKEIATVSSSLILAGTGSIIDGTGLISLGGVTLSGNNQSTASTANLQVIGADVTINAGITFTNNGTVEIGGSLIGGDATTAWVNASNSSLRVGGAIFAANGNLTATASGNTVTYFGTVAQNVILPASSSYYHLNISGTNTKTALGNLIVLGNLTIESGTLDLDALNNYSLTLAGNFDNSTGGVFNEQQSVVTLNGTSNQSITSLSTENIWDLTITNTGGTISSSVNINVLNTLDMQCAAFDLGTKTLTVGSSTVAVGSVNYTSGTVLGKFQKWIATTGSYFMPVGSASATNGVTINITTLGTGGSLITQFKATPPGSTGLPVADAPDNIYNPFLEGYWVLTEANSLNITGYDLTLNASGFTSFTIDATTRLMYRTTGGSWAVEGTHVSPSGSIIQRTGMSTMSAEFGVGDITPCTPPTTSAITGLTTVCTSDAGVGYSVTNTSLSSYVWTINGGTQATGGTTNTITVNWDAVGAIGSVAVQETNDCTVGASVSLTVNVEALPTSDISGRTYIPANAIGETYTVSTRTGYSYTWSVVGGSITGGQSTATVTITWGAAGAGQVCIDATNACGSAPQLCLDVTKYVVINSIGTGDYDLPTTWDCNCVPGSTDNVYVKSSHSVTLKANTTVNHLSVDGSLLCGLKSLIITGDLTVNGSIVSSSNSGITISGSGNIINGVGGVITNTSSGVKLTGGAKQFFAGSVLTFNQGYLNVNDGVVVTNNGSVTIGSGNLDANNASSTWINGASSTLILGTGTFPTTGTLIATATNNTVQYNGTIGQSVYDTDYYNLTTSGPSTTSLQSSRVLGGDMYIGSGSTFNTNNFNLNVAGNWTNDGGTFVPGSGTVTFDGSAVQTIGGTSNAETFNILVVDATSSLYVGASTTVTAGTLTSSGIMDNDGTLKANNGFSISGTLSGSGVHELTGGNWSNSGTFTAESSKVLFSGGIAQTITGATNFNDIEINNASGVSVSSGAQGITGTMTLTSGNFATGGLLTLISSASQTGRIDEITGGSISGNVTAQRYTSAVASWRFISAPITSSLLDWQQEFWTAGYTGATNPNYYGFVSLYTHDETALGDYSRYKYATSSGDAITPGTGYMAWVSPTKYSVPFDGVIDVTGTVFTGSLVKNVTYTDLGDGYEGWNLVANPYPSDIDLSLVGLSNVQNFAYVYDPSISDFISKSFSGGDVISQHQAFFVRSTAAGSVTFNESSKTTGSSTFYRSTNHKDLELFLAGSGFTHDARIRFNDDATNEFDDRFDAYQPRSLNYYAPYLATLSKSLDSLDINTIADSVSSISIPVLVRTGPTKSGDYTLSVGDLSVIDDRPCLYLEDLTEGIIIDLKKQSSYTFYLSDTVTMPRFLLHFGEKIKLENSVITCPKGNDGMVNVVPTGNGPWDVVFFDSDNAEIYNESNIVDPAITFNGLTAGNYSVEISNSDESCGTGRVSTVVTQPNDFESTISTDNINCNGANSGSLEILSTGGTGVHTYLWNNGSTSSSIENLFAGNYEVTVSDELGCSDNFAKALSEATPLEAVVSSNFIQCFGGSDGFIDVAVSGGVSPYKYLWNSGASINQLNSLESGTFTLTISDGNNCDKIITETLNQSTKIEPLSINKKVDCYGASTGSIEVTTTGGRTPYSYVWNTGMNSSKLEFVVAGNYEVTITDANNCIDIINESIVENSEIIPIEINNTSACYHALSGLSELEVNGGIAPYSYYWENGNEQPILTNVRAGNYNYSITDGLGCIKTGKVTIEEFDEIISDFTMSSETIYLSEGGEVSFVNLTSSSDSSLWDFGDGDTSIVNSPNHIYTDEGVYVVQLTVGNGNCEGSTQQVIEVKDKQNGTGINNTSRSDFGIYTVYDTKVVITNANNENYTIIIYNALGQNVYHKENVDLSTDQVDITALNNGVYFLTVNPEKSKSITYKFSK